MSNVEIIKSMLEDPESDNDELNALIWCFEHGKKYLGKTGGAGNNHWIDGHKSNELLCEQHIPDFVNSLDAAMSIGAEELEGWRISINDEGDHYQVNFYNIELDKIIQGYCCEILPRAIAHARIQALAYVRGIK